MQGMLKREMKIGLIVESHVAWELILLSGLLRPPQTLLSTCQMLVQPYQDNIPMSSSDFSTDNPKHKIRVQSNQISGELPIPECNIPKSLQKDLEDCLCRAGDNLIFNIFPDDAFGFAINERFAQHFHNIFLTAGGTINEKNIFSRRVDDRPIPQQDRHDSSLFI